MSDSVDHTGRIAIVGLAGRFPAARSPADLWRLLAGGHEATTWLDDDALLQAGVSPETLADPDYVKAAMVLPDMEMFDAGFFGFSPREAQILDPQHRHFLETCWEALENAGHVPRRFPGAIGVFGGCGMQAYMAENLLPNAKLRDSVGMFLLRHTGNDKDFLTTRVSYLLDLKGPSIGVQTACSTSLVAVHMACQSLMSGECDMALAGGVSIELPHRVGYIAAQGEILSPTGRCAAFDDNAKGTVFGSGAAVVVLRRLEDALADGDTIRAVILGTAVNNDGAGKAGYLAPSVEGQARAAEEAIGIAGIAPSSVDYIEAHGTGTVIGDPIELEALSQAYGGETAHGAIGIGSIKTNIGHLDTAAGVASLIKVVLGLEHALLPPTLNYQTPNSRFAFDTSPFQVVSQPRAWPRSQRPRRAAINSLGVGGTNAHAVIEEPPAPAPGTAGTASPSGFELFTLSAKSPAALDGLVAKWQAFVDDPANPLDLPSAAYTTHVGRDAFDHRVAIAAESRAALADALAGRRPRRQAKATAPGEAPDVVFMFPGGGAQYAGAGRGLYASNPAFRDAADACLALVPADAKPLAGLLFGPEADAPDAGERLEHPLLSILAVFTVSYALARMWESLGVRPSAVIGHSAGDYAAAVVAGVMRLDDAVALVAMRGEIFAALPAGAMLSVELDEAELVRRAGPDLDLAVVNATGLGVVSGDVPAIDRLAASLDADGIDCTRVRIGVAAHSRMLDPFLERFRKRLAGIRLSPPCVPMISSLTGDWADPAALTTPEHWVRHLRETVRFGDGLSTVLSSPDRVLLEVGPGRGLSALAKLAAPAHPPRAVVASTSAAIEPDDDAAVATVAAGHLWASGAQIDLAALRDPSTRQRVPLPTYAFERQRHWIDAPARRPALGDADQPKAVADPAPTAIERLSRPEDWFRAPTFVPEPLVNRVSTARQSTGHQTTALILTDGSTLATAVAAELSRRGVTVLSVAVATRLTIVDDATLAIDPTDPDHAKALVERLDQQGRRPDILAHAWSTSSAPSVKGGTPGFDSLLGLLQAVSHVGWDHPMRLAVVASGAAPATGSGARNPEAATLLGPVRVWPREAPGSSAVLIDLPAEAWHAISLAPSIADEMLTPSTETLVALRQGQRLVERLRPLPPASAPPRVRQGGVYLITGGLGGIGQLLAAHLSERFDARLVLVGRRPASALDKAARKALAALGEHALWQSADVTDEAAMAEVIATARRHFGRLDGVFHAAGSMADAPLAIKTHAEAHAVLSAKVDGGRVLDRLLPPGTIDLFAVFSSTSALLGPPGQIDYVAANAFLDALATGRPDGLAIDWGIWRDTGLAVHAGASQKSSVQAEPAPHPLLGHRMPTESATARFEATYHAAVLWALGEHVVTATPVLPGTASLEIALLALAAAAPGQDASLHGVELLQPLAVPFGTVRHVVTEVRSIAPDQARIEISSFSDSAPTPIVHVQASASFAPPQPIASIADWSEGALVAADDRVAQKGVVDFGPRWDSLREIRLGGGRASARLELPERFADDLTQHPYHPALLDMAATIGLHLLPASERALNLFVPATFARVVSVRPLTTHLVSEARLVASEPGRSVTFDVTIADRDGAVLMRIEGFELRAVRRAAFVEASPPGATGGALLPRLLAAGIRSADAPALLDRVLATNAPRVVVSSIALERLQRLYDEVSRPPPRSNTAPRTDVATGPAMTATETAIAAMFGELLGLDQVSPDAEFLALGGHSLAAVRLFARIRRQLGIDLGIATLFEAPSVKLLAQLIDEMRGEAPVPVEPPRPAPAPTPTVARDDPAARTATPPAPRRSRTWSPLVRIAKGEPGRPPLFWIHGAMGNVVSIKALADALPSHQPIYGLQAQGVDGRLPPLEKIEDMAVRYVAAIREVDPEGPYCLLGYSGGGLIGYEIARQLALNGQRVALLAMIDTLSPSHANGTRLTDWVRYGRTNGIGSLVEQVKNGWIFRIAELTRRLRKAPADPESQDALLLNSGRAFDAFIRAQERYFIQPYDGDIVLFRAMRSGIAFQMAGPTLGWGDHIGDRIELHELDADHGTIIQSPAIDLIADVMARHLDRAWKDRCGGPGGSSSSPASNGSSDGSGRGARPAPTPAPAKTSGLPLKAMTAAAMTVASVTFNEVRAAPRDEVPKTRSGNARPWSPLVRLDAGQPGRIPLICIHGAGGNIMWACRLQPHLRAGRPIYGLQAYGSDGHQKPLETIEEMARRYLEQLRLTFPQGPYALLGYSGGGVIGYEMARQLAGTDRSVAVLAMIDTLAPSHAHDPGLVAWLRYGSQMGATEVANQAKFAALEWLGPQLRPWLPLRPSRDQMDPVLANAGHQFDSYVRAQARYRIHPQPVDILLFRALNAGVMYHAAGPSLGWVDHVGERVDVQSLNADHKDIIEGPTVAVIANILEERLSKFDRAAAAEPPALPRPNPTAARSGEPPVDANHRAKS